jgi:predicted nucleotidyltransferase
MSPPSWLVANVMYETIMGSYAFGVATDTSDFDTVGFCIPPKDLVFPHLAGHIEGFGRQKQKFTCYQKHHVFVQDDQGGKGREYDLNIYSIVHYFNLCMENNPNMIASLFTPQECVLHSTTVANMVRDKRKLFLHKGCWHRFKGYAYNQLHKMRTKTQEPGSKRAIMVERFGYDVKFAYHVVRLLDEVEQILTEGDLDIRRNKAQLKAIRRGEVPEEEIHRWASEKEKALEKAYEDSKLPYGPNQEAIKKLLLECLEEHWGTIEGCVVSEDRIIQSLRDIAEVIDRNRKLLG